MYYFIGFSLWRTCDKNDFIIWEIVKLWNIQHFLLFCISDLSNFEGKNDAIRYPDGWLPAGRQASKLLPQHHLECSGNRVGHRLPASGDWPVRVWSVSWLITKRKTIVGQTVVIFTRTKRLYYASGCQREIIIIWGLKKKQPRILRVKDILSKGGLWKSRSWPVLRF